MSGAFRADLLAGRVALVTGGGTGIGRAIAEAFAAHGARVALAGRRADVVEQAAREIGEATGAACLAMAADVRDPARVEAAVAQVVAAFGRLDVVVNNAAGNFLCPAAALSPNGFRTVVDIDACGTWNVSRAAFHAHLRDHGGAILNISATLHYGATPLQLHASAAKAAVDALTRSLALEWGPLGIRVNAIAPGPIGDTEGMRRLSTPELRARYEKAVPLGRFGCVGDIASAALFLASDAASWCTGAVLVVDGGAWLHGLPFELAGGA